MSYDVVLVVCFRAWGSTGVQVLASRCLPAVREQLLSDSGDYRGRVEAVQLLEYVARGEGFAEGRNGGMFTWGTVSDHTDIDGFVDALWPYLRELLSHHDAPSAEWHGPGAWDSVVVLHEGERSDDAGAVEITAADAQSRAQDPAPGLPELSIRRAAGLPFSLQPQW